MQVPVFQPRNAFHMQTISLYRNCYPRTAMLNYKLIMKSECSSQWYSLKYWIDSIRNTNTEAEAQTHQSNTNVRPPTGRERQRLPTITRPFWWHCRAATPCLMRPRLATGWTILKRPALFLIDLWAIMESARTRRFAKTRILRFWRICVKNHRIRQRALFWTVFMATFTTTKKPPLTSLMVCFQNLMTQAR